MKKLLVLVTLLLSGTAAAEIPYPGPADYKDATVIRTSEIDAVDIFVMYLRAFGSVDDRIDRFPIKDRNPVRFAGLQEEAKQKIAKRSEEYGSRIYFQLPITRAKIRKDYDAERNMFMLLLPGHVQLNLSGGDYKPTFETIYMPPLVTWPLRKGVVCCHDQYIDQMAKKRYTHYQQIWVSNRQKVQFFMENAKQAERIYDIDKAGNLYVEVFCEAFALEGRPNVCLAEHIMLNEGGLPFAELWWNGTTYQSTFYVN